MSGRGDTMNRSIIVDDLDGESADETILQKDDKVFVFCPGKANESRTIFLFRNRPSRQSSQLPADAESPFLPRKAGNIRQYGE